MRAARGVGQDTTEFQIVMATSIREETIGADAYEAGRQDVQEEAADPGAADGPTSRGAEDADPRSWQNHAP